MAGNLDDIYDRIFRPSYTSDLCFDSPKLGHLLFCNLKRPGQISFGRRLSHWFWGFPHFHHCHFRLGKTPDFIKAPQMGMWAFTNAGIPMDFHSCIRIQDWNQQFLTRSHVGKTKPPIREWFIAAIYRDFSAWVSDCFPHKMQLTHGISEKHPRVSLNPIKIHRNTKIQSKSCC